MIKSVLLICIEFPFPKYRTTNLAIFLFCQYDNLLYVGFIYNGCPCINVRRHNTISQIESELNHRIEALYIRLLVYGAANTALLD